MRRQMYSLLGMLMMTACFLAVHLTPASAADQWFWLYSDDKYSKFIDPVSVVVTHTAKTKDGRVPTEIQGWIKTGYSYAGAAETIANYEIKNVIPNPAQLSHSLAQVSISPQNRTIQYLKENFYDFSGKVIWSKLDGRVKEITSQEFDEDFYAAIVDEVFRRGEMDRCKAKDRWIDLWSETNAQGIKTSVTADTTTMRLKGDNLILWEWLQREDAKGNVLEIKFMKKAVNLPNATERVVVLNYWSPGTNWEIIEDDMNGAYRLIQEKDAEYKGLTRLRAFAKGYSTWVKRYSLE